MIKRKEKTKEKSILPFIFKWLKDNSIALIFSFLLFSALFNIGYFLFLDFKYISFLNISDYYAGTMIFLSVLFIMFFNLIMFFISKEGNSFAGVFDGILHCVKTFYKIFSVKKRIRYIIQHGNKKNIRQVKKFDLELLQMKNDNIKNIKMFILYFIFLIFACIVTFGWVYALFGIVAFYIGISLFLIIVFLDYISSSYLSRQIIRILALAIFAIFLGYCMLNSNVKNKNIEICDNNNCYNVLRKIENGYFVLDKKDLLFINNESKVQTRQELTKNTLLFIGKKDNE